MPPALAGPRAGQQREKPAGSCPEGPGAALPAADSLLAHRGNAANSNEDENAKTGAAASEGASFRGRWPCLSVPSSPSRGQ